MLSVLSGAKNKRRAAVFIAEPSCMHVNAARSKGETEGGRAASPSGQAANTLCLILHLST